MPKGSIYFAGKRPYKGRDLEKDFALADRDIRALGLGRFDEVRAYPEKLEGKADFRGYHPIQKTLLDAGVPLEDVDPVPHLLNPKKARMAAWKNYRSIVLHGVSKHPFSLNSHVTIAPDPRGYRAGMREIAKDYVSGAKGWKARENSGSRAAVVGAALSAAAVAMYALGAAGGYEMLSSDRPQLQGPGNPEVSETSVCGMPFMLEGQAKKNSAVLMESLKKNADCAVLGRYAGRTRIILAEKPRSVIRYDASHGMVAVVSVVAAYSREYDAVAYYAVPDGNFTENVFHELSHAMESCLDSGEERMLADAYGRLVGSPELFPTSYSLDEHELWAESSVIKTMGKSSMHPGGSGKVPDALAPLLERAYSKRAKGEC